MCPIPEFLGTTVSDLQLYTIDLQGEIKKCNAQTQKEVEWFDKVEQELNEEK